MADRRRPGSDLGRPAIEWEDAFAFYASLPAPVRSYAAVAAEFGVSRRTVEEHGAREHWQERVRAIEADAAATVAAELSQAQAEQRAEIIQIAKAVLLRFAHQLRTGEARISGAEFQRVSTFLLELMDDADAASASGDPATAAPGAAAPARPREDKAAVLQALQESGALADLLAALAPPAPTDNEEQEDGDHDDDAHA